MDKIDGPYYFFKAIQKVRARCCREWFPLVGLEVGKTNIVPVDYVAARDGPHRPPGRARRPGVPPRRPEAAAVGRRDEHVRPRRRTRRSWSMRIDKRMTDMLPKGVLRDAMQLPALKGIARPCSPTSASPTRSLDYIELHRAVRRARHRARARGHRASRSRRSRRYADKLWDYWERNLDPDLFKDRSFEGAVNGKTVIITGASSGIGLRRRAQDRAPPAGSRCSSRAREDKLEEAKAEIEAAGGTAYALLRPTSPTSTRSTRSSSRSSSEHARVDILVNNAGRSIRRSVALSYDRFHDYERTMQLNYFGAIKLILGAAAAHARAAASATSSTSPRSACRPTRRASRAYVASKAALDAFTRVGRLRDDRRQRHLHDDPHAARAHADDRADEDLRLVPDDLPRRGGRPDLRGDPRQAQADQHAARHVRRGALRAAPKAVDQILHMAYKVFPDSAAAKGKKDPDERASGEAIALAHLMKGVHW